MMSRLLHVANGSSVTDTLAEAPYQGLRPSELDRLMALLEPIAIRLRATGSA